MIEELIANGQYSDALEVLTNTSDELVRYQRLLCLVGLEQYEQALHEAVVAKDSATTTYYDVVGMYVEVLKELNDYEQAIDILIEELQMPYIPNQYADMYNAAYDHILSLKFEQNQAIKRNTKEVFTEDQMEEILFGDNPDLMMMVIEQLESYNLRNVIYIIKSFLQDPTRNSVLKSILLEMCIDQEIEEDLLVIKNGYEIDINPSYLEKVLDHESSEMIIEMLGNAIADENPSLYEMCAEFLQFYLYHMYPIFIDEENYSLVAAGIHYYMAMLNGIEMDSYELCELYNIDEDDLEEQLQIMKEIQSE